jgi:type IV secretion system protein VirB10
VIVLLILLIFGGPAPSSRTSTTAEAQPGNPRDIERITAEMDRRAAELRRMQDRAMTEVAAATTEQQQQNATVLAGTRDPNYPAQQAQQIDPIAAEELRFKAEMHRRRLLRAFADPQAMSLLRDIYGNREPAIAPAETEPAKPEREEPKPETERKYTIREGNFLETVLVNRLDSTFTGPVKVLVSENLWSRDRTALLIPKGTEVLGEAKAVESLGQRRVAVVFHRLIRPDDVSIDLDQFGGLNQIGETGLTDKVNNH